MNIVEDIPLVLRATAQTKAMQEIKERGRSIASTHDCVMQPMDVMCLEPSLHAT